MTESTIPRSVRQIALTIAEAVSEKFGEISLRHAGYDIDDAAEVIAGLIPMDHAEIIAELDRLESAAPSPRDTPVSRLRRAIGQPLALGALLDEATATVLTVQRSGLDRSPCRLCGQDVFCIPDGLPFCEACAEGLSE